MSQRVDEREITRLLADLRRGDRGAEELLIPLIYTELRRIARAHLRQERPDHTLQTTALVHEAYLKLLRRPTVEWQDRAHFFGVAARVMRRILIDHARSRHAAKRGGLSVRVPLDDNIADVDTTWDQLIGLHRALDALAEHDPRRSRVVELRFFGGLDLEGTAEVLGVSSRTVKRDWDFAQAWLYTYMTGEI